jgi:endonuclease/exonuclease/phosphatase family metal-dependent hydrolase
VNQEELDLTPFGVNFHLTDRDAILMRTDVDIGLIGVQSQQFPTTITLPPPLNPIHGGYVSVDAIVRGLPLRFVSVHLIPNPTTILVHTHQLLQLAANTTTLPLVFGGDFNTTADDPSDPSYKIYQTLIDAGLTDAWNPLRPGPTCCQDPNLLNAQSKLDHRIDLILLRGAFAVEPINLIGNKPSDRTPSGLWPSDHAGVVATLAGPEGQ